MSMDDCFIPFHLPSHEIGPFPDARSRGGSHPCLSQLDLDECAAMGAGKARVSGSHGETGVYRRTLQLLNRPVAVPPRRLLPSLGPLLKISPGSEQPLHLQTPSLFKENSDVLPEEPKQHHPSQVAVSRTAARGRYARSRAGWASKERSTPEGLNLEEHAWRFQFPFAHRPLYPPVEGLDDFDSAPPVVLRLKKPPEVRNARRAKRVAQRQIVSQHHAELALRKYNRANNTKFELVEVRLSCLFFEFGGGCHHYNFTAKPADHHSADGSMKLFFSEVNYCPKGENDVLHCCIVGEKDAGHCYGCKGTQPMMVHPTSQAYGGGNTNVIDMPGSDGSSSDSD